LEFNNNSNNSSIRISGLVHRQVGGWGSAPTSLFAQPLYGSSNTNDTDNNNNSNNNNNFGDKQQEPPPPPPPPTYLGGVVAPYPTYP